MRIGRKAPGGAQRRHVKRQHKMVSDRSGFVFPANEVVRQWDGLLVHKDEEEPRHPQEFVRGVVDDYAVRNPRPRAPYEATLFEGDAKSFLYLVDRDGNELVDRDGNFLVTRDQTLSISDNLYLVDRDGNELVDRDGNLLVTREQAFSISDNIILANLGLVKDISRVIFSFSALSGSKDRLNIYTSEDGVEYTGLTSPFVDIVRGFQVGDVVSVSIGRRAQYVAMRFDSIDGSTIRSSFVLTQFDVIGEV